MYLRFCLILINLLMCGLAHATLFSNQYVSFELPPNWNCKSDGTEWICISQLEKQSKEAIILLAAKEVGPTDSLEAYTAHLSSSRPLSSAGGKVTPSQKLSVKSRTINNHPWVDGMHLGSEVNSYYTRYLATVKDHLAIAVTFSAHKSHYTKYSQDFLKAIESLRATAAKDILSAPVANEATGISEQMGTAQADPFSMNGMDVPPEPTANKNSYMRYAIGLLLIIAAVAVYLMRKK